MSRHSGRNFDVIDEVVGEKGERSCALFHLALDQDVDANSNNRFVLVAILPTLLAYSSPGAAPLILFGSLFPRLLH